jgi:hypothetical protein
LLDSAAARWVQQGVLWRENEEPSSFTNAVNILLLNSELRQHVVAQQAGINIPERTASHLQRKIFLPTH